MNALRKLVIRIESAFNNSGFKKADAAVNEITKKTNQKIGTMEKSVTASLGRIGTLLGVAFSAKAITNYSDAYASALGKMKIATNDYKRALDDVYKNSLDTGTSFTDNANLLSTILMRRKDFSVIEAVNLQDIISKAIAATSSGKDADATVLRNFSDILSGSTNSIDLRMMLKNSSGIAELMQRAFGKNQTELIEAFQKGLIKTDDIIKAIVSQKEVVNEMFNKAPRTFGQAVQNLNSGLTKTIGELTQASAISEVFYKFTSLIVENLKMIAYLGIFFVIRKGLLALMPIYMKYFRFTRMLSFLYMKDGAGSRFKAIGQVLAVYLLPHLKAVIAKSKVLFKQFLLFEGIRLIVQDIYYWFKGWGSATGDLIGSFEQFKKKFQPLINAFSWLDDKLSSFGVNLKKVSGLALTFGSVGYVAFKAVKSGIFAVYKGFQGIIWVLNALRIAMLSNPIGLILTAIAVVVALIVYYWDDIVYYVKIFYSWLKEKINKAVDWLLEKWEGFKQVCHEVVDSIIEIGKAINEWINEKIDAAVAKFKAIVDMLGKANDKAKAANSATGHGTGISNRNMNMSREDFDKFRNSNTLTNNVTVNVAGSSNTGQLGAKIANKVVGAISTPELAGG